MARGWKVWTAPSGPNWRCRWSGKHGSGHRTFVYKNDADELTDAKRRDFQRRDAGLDPLPSAPRQITLGEGADEYLAYSKAEKGSRTYRNFVEPAVSSIKEFLGPGVLLAEIQPADIQRWKHSLPSTTTASMKFTQVRAFLNYMVAMKRIAENPAKPISRPREGPGGRALTEDEVSAIFSNAPDELYRAGLFSLNTMLRIDEVCRFDWSQVSEVFGGEWMGRIPWQERKTRGKVRVDCFFPINGQARAVMGPVKKTGRVFNFPPVTVQHQIIRVRRAAKLPEDITFHCFRHTGATRYLAAGGHMEDLLKTRLWSDHRSLLRYIHVEPKTLIPRFAAMQIVEIAPPQRQQSKGRQPDPSD